MQMWSPSAKKMIPVGPPGQICISAEKEKNSSSWIKPSPASTSSWTGTSTEQRMHCKKMLFFDGSDDTTVTVVDGSMFPVILNAETINGSVEEKTPFMFKQSGDYGNHDETKKSGERTPIKKEVVSPTPDSVVESMRYAAVTALSPKLPLKVHLENSLNGVSKNDNGRGRKIARKKDAHAPINSGDEVLKWVGQNMPKTQEKREFKEPPQESISFPTYEETEVNFNPMPIMLPSYVVEEEEDEDYNYSNPYLDMAPICSSKQELEALHDMENPKPSTSRALRREMNKIWKAAAKRERLQNKALNGNGASCFLHETPTEINENVNYLSPRRSARVLDSHPARSRSSVRQNLFPEVPRRQAPRKRKHLRHQSEAAALSETEPQFQAATTNTKSPKGKATSSAAASEVKSTTPSYDEWDRASRTPSPIKLMTKQLNGRGVQVKKLRLAAGDNLDSHKKENPFVLNTSKTQPRAKKNPRGTRRLTKVKQDRDRKFEVVDLTRGDPSPNESPKKQATLIEASLVPMKPAASPMKMPTLQLHLVKLDEQAHSPNKMPKLDVQEDISTVQQRKRMAKFNGMESQSQLGSHGVEMKLKNPEFKGVLKSSKDEEAWNETGWNRVYTARVRRKRGLENKMEASITADIKTMQTRNVSVVKISSDVAIEQSTCTTGKPHLENEGEMKNGNNGVSPFPKTDLVNAVPELTIGRSTRSRSLTDQNVKNADKHQNGLVAVLPEIEIARNVKQSPVPSEISEPDETIATWNLEALDVSTGNKDGSGKGKTEDLPIMSNINPVVILQQLDQPLETRAGTSIASGKYDEPEPAIKVQPSEPSNEAAVKSTSRSSSRLPQASLDNKSSRISRLRKQTSSSERTSDSGTGNLPDAENVQSQVPATLKKKLQFSELCPNEVRVKLLRLEDDANLMDEYPEYNNNDKMSETMSSSSSRGDGSVSSTETSPASSSAAFDETTGARRSVRTKRPLKRADDEDWVWYLAS